MQCRKAVQQGDIVIVQQQVIMTQPTPALPGGGSAPPEVTDPYYAEQGAHGGYPTAPADDVCYPPQKGDVEPPPPYNTGTMLPYAE